jgi:hypothetical protein
MIAVHISHHKPVRRQLSIIVPGSFAQKESSRDVEFPRIRGYFATFTGISWDNNKGNEYPCDRSADPGREHSGEN